MDTVLENLPAGIDTAEQEAVGVIRDKIERTLQNAGLTRSDYFGWCGQISGDLQKALTADGISTKPVSSTDKDSNGHIYLIAAEKGFEILIDPTIGQFIKGHNHVFVGTRRQLHQLVTENTGEGKPYQIVNTKSRNPEEAFQRIWGWGKNLGS